MTKELIGVQYLRGIAAMLVVLHHLHFETTQLGPYGVKIFFVISGFVMWHATLSADTSAMAFWRRRIVRIVPLYWIHLSLLVAVALVAPQFLKSTVISPEAVLKSYLFVPYYNTGAGVIAPILIPGWSLNYEAFFYLLFGISLFIRPSAFRAIFVAGLLWSLVLLGQWIDPTSPAAVTYTSPNLLLFFDGIILAVVFRAHGAGSLVLGMILIAAGVLLGSVGAPGDLGRFESFIGLSPALVVAGALALEPTLRRFPSSIVHTIGSASYSIYLSHLFFLRLSELGWRSSGAAGSSQLLQAAYVVFTFVFAIAGGVAVYYLIERPILVSWQSKRLTQIEAGASR